MGQHRRWKMAETKVERIIRNAVRCKKCGQTIESKHHHDFVSCACGNFVDGGHDYLRRGGKLSDMEELSEYLPEKTEKQKRAEQTRLCLWLQALDDENSI